MKNKIILIVSILIIHHSSVIPEENKFYPSDKLIIDGGIGYGIHTNEIKVSPVDYERGGLYLYLRLSYMFNAKAGISLLGGYTNLYSHKELTQNSNLYAFPLELAYNITFQRIKFLTGFGLYFVKSRIEGDALLSVSNYLDPGYFISGGYLINLDFITLFPEIKLNYLIDTEVLSITPMLSISFSL